MENKIPSLLQNKSSGRSLLEDLISPHCPTPLMMMNEKRGLAATGVKSLLRQRINCPLFCNKVLLIGVKYLFVFVVMLLNSFGLWTACFSLVFGEKKKMRPSFVLKGLMQYSLD